MFLDHPEEITCCVDPPGVAGQIPLVMSTPLGNEDQVDHQGSIIPEQCLPWADLLVNRTVDVVKVGKVGVDLGHPVWLDQDDRADVEKRQLATHERPVLHPRNDVVERPGYDESDGAGGQVPSVNRGMGEDECAMRQGQNQLPRRRPRSMCIFRIKSGFNYLE